MNKEIIKEVRKLVQQYAYTSIGMHAAVARKAGFSGTGGLSRKVQPSGQQLRASEWKCMHIAEPVFSSL